MGNINNFETEKKAENRGEKRLSLDTLSLSRHKNLLEGCKRQKENLTKRARSKWYTQKIIGSLLYTDSELHKYYQRAYYCNHILTQNEGKIKGKYCNTRVCNICNRIRTAKLIKGYLSQLEERDLQFTTLTVPNVPAEDLRDTIEGMIRDASNILKVFRTRRKQPLNGIRKLEVTYNSQRNDFHPHFHFLLDGQGEKVVDEWLIRRQNSILKAQDCKQVSESGGRSKKEAMKELFKYTTKIIGRKKGNFTVYVDALDTIMTALWRKRSFQPFGDIYRISEDVDEDLQAQEIDSYEPIQWIWHEAGDWVDVDTGECLTDYDAPSHDFLYRFENDVVNK